MRRDGAQWEMRFKQGQPVGALKKVGAARGSGTTVFFRPDSTIFPKVEFDPDTIKQRLEVVELPAQGACKITFEDETRNEKHVFQHSEGLADYLKTILRERIGGAGARSAIRAFETTARTAAFASTSRCSGPSRPTSTCAATSTASRPDLAARTRTGSAPGSARRCATSSTRTTSRRKA